MNDIIHRKTGLCFHPSSHQRSARVRTSDDSYIYQLSLVLATATVSFYAKEILRTKFVVTSRSPRWTSGSPRMLLVFVREFESCRGEILNIFAKKKKENGSTAESA